MAQLDIFAGFLGFATCVILNLNLAIIVFEVPSLALGWLVLLGKDIFLAFLRLVSHFGWTASLRKRLLFLFRLG